MQGIRTRTAISEDLMKSVSEFVHEANNQYLRILALEDYRGDNRKHFEQIHEQLAELNARVKQLEESRTPESILAHTPLVERIDFDTQKVLEWDLAAELYAIRHDCDASEFCTLPTGAEPVYLDTARKLLEKYHVLTKEVKP